MQLWLVFPREICSRMLSCRCPSCRAHSAGSRILPSRNPHHCSGRQTIAIAVVSCTRRTHLSTFHFVNDEEYSCPAFIEDPDSLSCLASSFRYNILWSVVTSCSNNGTEKPWPRFRSLVPHMAHVVFIIKHTSKLCVNSFWFRIAVSLFVPSKLVFFCLHRKSLPPHRCARRLSWILFWWTFSWSMLTCMGKFHQLLHGFLQFFDWRRVPIGGSCLMDGCQEQEHPNSSHSRPRGITEYESSTNCT